MAGTFIKALVGASCFWLACVNASAQAAPTGLIIGERWELVELTPLPGGEVQLRLRPKAASAPVPAAHANDEARPVGPAEVKPPPVQPASVAATTPLADPVIGSLQDLAAVDLSVPASPAMAVLGMTGTEVQRPAFPRDLVASLVRGFDKDGKAKNALAIDVAPVALLFPESIIGGQQYQDNYWMQLRARTTLSFAAAEVENGNGASQLAAGLRIGLIDQGDPGLQDWRKLTNCVKKQIASVPIPSGPTNDDPNIGPVLRKAEKECGLDKASDLWAKPALYVGYAQAWYSGSGAIKDATDSARTVWASYSVGLNSRSEADLAAGAPSGLRALLQFYGARKLDDRVKNPSGADNFVREDRSDLIARLRFGRANWQAFVDAGRSRVRTAGTDTENVNRVGFGIEYRLLADLWLVAGKVKETGYAAGGRDLISTGLRFGQTPKSIFGPVGQGK